MKINYRKDVWKVYDFFLLLRFIADETFEDTFYENYSVKLNKKVQKFITRMRKEIDYDNEHVKFFFHEDTRRVFHIMSYKKMRDINTLDEALRIYEELKEDEIRFEVFFDYYVNSPEWDGVIDEDRIRGFYKDEKSIIDFIGNLDITEESRWKLLKFIQNPKDTVHGFLKSLDKFIKVYNKEILKYESLMDEFAESIQERIDREGDNIFSDLLGNLMTPDYYENMEIRTSFVAFYGFRIDGMKEFPVISVGFDYLNAVEAMRGKDQENFVIKTISEITEETNFKILSVMKNSELYGKEICDKTGISKAVVSYHMGKLVNRGLINVRREGKKIFYSIKKDKLEDVIDSLKDYFI